MSGPTTFPTFSVPSTPGGATWIADPQSTTNGGSLLLDVPAAIAPSKLLVLITGVNPGGASCNIFGLDSGGVAQNEALPITNAGYAHLSALVYSLITSIEMHNSSYVGNILSAFYPPSPLT